MKKFLRISILCFAWAYVAACTEDFDEIGKNPNAAETVNAIIEYLSTGSTEYYHYTPLTFIDAENVQDFIGKGEF